MDKKVKKAIIVLIVLIVMVVGFKLIGNKKNTPEVLVKYIEKIGFEQEKDSSLYFKNNSNMTKDEFDMLVAEEKDASYEGFYFNVGSYKLTSDKLEYSDDVYTEFNPTYDYTNNTLDYDYRISIDDARVIIEGIYDKDNDDFTCEPTYYIGIDIDDAIEAICDKVKYDVDDFRYDALTLITRYDILEGMQKVDKEK